MAALIDPPDALQGGPSTPSTPTSSPPRRRDKHRKSPSLPRIDWPPSGEPRPRSSPHHKRHGDIEPDGVKASGRKHRPPPPPTTTSPPSSPTNSTATSTTTIPSPVHERPSLSRSRSMRVPNSSVPVLARAATAPQHRRPTYVYEEDEDDEDDDDDEEDDDEDDDDDEPPPPPRLDSRRNRSEPRRDPSPLSAHPHRSTPESRRSLRTSAPESDDETGVTYSSDDEQVILHHHHRKEAPVVPHAPPVPPAPAAPAPPPVSRSVHDRPNRRPEVVYEEDIGIPERVLRHTPSFARPRSPSRHSSARRDQYRRPRDEYRQESAFEEDRSRSQSKRPSPRKYYESESYVSRPSSSVKRSHAAETSHQTPSHSVSSSTRRSMFLGNFFGSTLNPMSEKPVRSVECVACLDEAKPVHKTAKLKCGHRMCHSCIRRSFKLSLHDPQSMPPKCCTSHIPINVVERLFDTNFKRQWNNKLAEYSTRNRIYCPSRRCDEWIRPEDIRREDGRKYAKCSRCKTKVCCHCGNKWHSSRECPRDEDTSQLLEQAKREGWQRCHRCKYVVELKEGCNHMTCRCGAEFCMICGTKWKRCECPWFNFDTQESDPLDHMQVPMTPRSNPFASGTRFPPTGSGPPSPREFRTDSGPPPPHAVRPRPVNYEEEMLLRRLQEQRDEKVARRARTFGGFSGHEEPEDYSRGRDYSRHRGDAMDREVHPGRSVAEEYHRRPETVIVPSPPLTHQPTAPPAPHSTFDRSNSGLDYVSGVSRARGMRYVSPERRYASPERYHASSPERRQPHTPDIWQSQSRNPSRNASRPPSAERRPPLAAETWPAPSIERRRYASPERSRPPSAEKRRAPERPRTSSLERRLAGRFGNTDSRQTAATTVGLMGPVASMSHVGIMGPVAVMEPMGVMSSTRAPPPPSRAATHPLGPPLPQAPAPPPAVPMVPTSRRKPIGEEDVYVSSRHARSAEWPVTPGRAHQEPEGTSGSPHAPSVKRRPPKANRVHKQDGPTASMLAGISGPGRGPDRVTEWRLYVEPGEPEGKESPAVS